MSKHSNKITHDKALIWRLAHVDDIESILTKGLYSSSFSKKHHYNIYSSEAIKRRSSRVVPIIMSGVLADYVDFQFTPSSPLFLNFFLSSEKDSIEKKDKFVFLVSSLFDIESLGGDFLFTNKNAALLNSDFFNDLSDLKNLDWDVLSVIHNDIYGQSCYDIEAAQAEALIYKHVPASAFMGIITLSLNAKSSLEKIIFNAGLDVPIYVREQWYF